MLAAITGAIAASGLGIAGTIAGAAFLSLVSTVGAAVYRLYLARGNDRLRAAAAALAPRTTGSVVAATIVRRHGSPATGPGAGHDPGRPAGPGPDAATRSLSPAGRAAGDMTEPAGDHTRTWLRDTAPGGAADSGSGGSGNEGSGNGESRNGESGNGSSGNGESGSTESGTGLPGTGLPGTGAGAGGSGPDRTRWLTGGRRRWLVAAVAALGVFVAAMGVVTAIEAMAGKPLEAVVWHKKASGTTVGGLVDGPAAQPRHSHPPRSASPSAPASPSGTPSSTAPATPTPTPAPTGSSWPAPTPSGSSPAAPASTAPAGPGTPGGSVSSRAGVAAATAPSWPQWLSAGSR